MVNGSDLPTTPITRKYSFQMISSTIIFYFGTTDRVAARRAGWLAQRGGGYDLSWNTLFSVGAKGGGLYTMDSAIGQPFAGKASSSSYNVCASFFVHLVDGHSSIFATDPQIAQCHNYDPYLLHLIF